MSEPLHQYRYQNITISGLPGCGSTTLLKMLKEELMFDGWKGFSGGEFMRAYAAEKGLFDPSTKLHHSAAHYEDDFDRQVDMGMREKLSKESKWIIESWLSGFMARKLKNTLRVLLVCSNDALKIDRVANRDKVTIEQAKKFIKEREENNFMEWKKIYGNYNFWSPKYYHLIIDTYSSGPLQTVGKVLDKLGYDNEKIFITKK